MSIRTTFAGVQIHPPYGSNYFTMDDMNREIWTSWKLSGVEAELVINAVDSVMSIVCLTVWKRRMQAWDPNNKKEFSSGMQYRIAEKWRDRCPKQ